MSHCENRVIVGTIENIEAKPVDAIVGRRYLTIDEGSIAFTGIVFVNWRSVPNVRGELPLRLRQHKKMTSSYQ